MGHRDEQRLSRGRAHANVKRRSKVACELGQAGRVGNEEGGDEVGHVHAVDFAKVNLSGGNEETIAD